MINIQHKSTNKDQQITTTETPKEHIVEEKLYAKKTAYKNK